MSITQEKSGYRNPIHNPFPASLSSECKKAGKIIHSFVYSSLTAIPHKILADARGLVICTVFRCGFLGSFRFGSGLMVARLPDGSWSAPSAIALGGLGVGGQFGFELTDFVFVLNTDAAVQTFLKSGNITISLNTSVAFGPGRSAEAGAIMGTNGIDGIYAYSKTRGLYGGVTLEETVIFERTSANKKIYERKLKAMQLLNGEIPPPPEAEPLMRILNSEAFRLRSSVGTPDAAELSADIPSATVQGPSEVAAESLPVPELGGQSSHQEIASSNTSEQAVPHDSARHLETAESEEATGSQDMTAPHEEAESQEATRSQDMTAPHEEAESQEATRSQDMTAPHEEAESREATRSQDMTAPHEEAESQEAIKCPEVVVDQQAASGPQACMPHETVGSQEDAVLQEAAESKEATVS